MVKLKNMNDDLISRSAAVEMLREKARGYVVSMFATSEDCHLARSVALEAATEIAAMPGVDAVPVRHGKWIKHGYACGETEWECSGCGETEWRASANWMKFCMYCGAKMDEEVSGNDRL